MIDHQPTFIPALVHCNFPTILRHSSFIIYIQLYFTMQWMRKCSFYWSIRLCMHNDINKGKNTSLVSQQTEDSPFHWSFHKNFESSFSKHFLLKCRTFILWVPALVHYWWIPNTDIPPIKILLQYLNYFVWTLLYIPLFIWMNGWLWGSITLKIYSGSLKNLKKNQRWKVIQFFFFTDTEMRRSVGLKGKQ